MLAQQITVGPENVPSWGHVFLCTESSIGACFVFACSTALSFSQRLPIFATPGRCRDTHTLPPPRLLVFAELFAQLDQRDRWRETPLHKAARSGNPGVVKALCAARMKVWSEVRHKSPREGSSVARNLAEARQGAGAGGGVLTSCLP